MFQFTIQERELGRLFIKQHIVGGYNKTAVLPQRTYILEMGVIDPVFFNQGGYIKQKPGNAAAIAVLKKDRIACMGKFTPEFISIIRRQE